MVREDRSVLDVLTPNYTFVNERLARHYGIPNVYGSDFRRVTVEKERRGLLGQGSFLTITSAPNRTSPVTRGSWILENLLGSPPPSPPPNVPPLPENTNGQGVTTVPTSVRDRMTLHRANQPCKGCHQLMDPIGLALENFDGIGRWRSEDAGTKIDASGQLVDGTPIDGVETLRNAILSRPDAFVQTMTRKALDVCRRTRQPLLRHAGDSNDRARSFAEQLSIFVHRHSDREQRPIPDESQESRGDPMMFITKKHLSRRTFLRGAGVTVALPFLESMVPAQTPLKNTAGDPEDPSWLLLRSAWRHDVQVDAGGRRQGFSVLRNAQPSRKISRSALRRQQSVASRLRPGRTPEPNTRAPLPFF